MERSLLVYSFFIVLSQIVQTSDSFQNAEHVSEEYEKRSNALHLWSKLYLRSKQPLPLWFGPRLGRSKRSANDIDTEMLTEMNCDQVESFVKLLAVLYDSKCLASNKSRKYVPRLGRDSGEEMQNEYSS